MTFPAIPHNNVWTDIGTGSFTDPKIYVVQTTRRSLSAACSCAPTPATSSSTRPAERHHGIRRRAVGPPLDHHRHLPRGARPGPPADHGRQVPVCTSSPTRPRASSRKPRSPGTALPGRRLRRHPPRLRLRAGAAHHAEVHRQQPRHRRGHDPRPDRRGHQAHADFELLYDKPYEDKHARCG
jgi:hypothetical protein